MGTNFQNPAALLGHHVSTSMPFSQIKDIIIIHALVRVRGKM
jgi:hypothetical protein